MKHRTCIDAVDFRTSLELLSQVSQYSFGMTIFDKSNVIMLCRKCTDVDLKPKVILNLINQFVDCNQWPRKLFISNSSKDRVMAVWFSGQ